MTWDEAEEFDTLVYYLKFSGKSPDQLAELTKMDRSRVLDILQNDHRFVYEAATKLSPPRWSLRENVPSVKNNNLKITVESILRAIEDNKDAIHASRMQRMMREKEEQIGLWKWESDYMRTSPIHKSDYRRFREFRENLEKELLEKYDTTR